MFATSKFYLELFEPYCSLCPRFVLLSTGNALCLYSYSLDAYKDKKNDLKRLQNYSKYKPGACMEPGIILTWLFRELRQSFCGPVHNVVVYRQLNILQRLPAHNAFVSYLAFTAGSNRSLHVLDVAVSQTVRVFQDAHSRPNT